MAYDFDYCDDLQVIQRFYLQNKSAGYCGNAPYWWRRGGSGYTTRPADAEEFLEADADAIIASTKGTHEWEKWPVEVVRKAAHPSIDMQDLHRVNESQKKAVKT